jgi:hypothetical protein
MHTTLNKIHEQCDCKRGWNALATYLGKHLPDETKVTMRTIYEATGLQGAIWALRVLDGCEKEKEEFVEFCKTPRTQEEIIIKYLELFGD